MINRTAANHHSVVEQRPDYSMRYLSKLALCTCSVDGVMFGKTDAKIAQLVKFADVYSC